MKSDFLGPESFSRPDLIELYLLESFVRWESKHFKTCLSKSAETRERDFRISMVAVPIMKVAKLSSPSQQGKFLDEQKMKKPRLADY